METRLFFNIVAIVGAGAFAGVMLNIGLTPGAYWKSLPPDAFLQWFGENSHLIGRTIPIVAVPTLLGLVVSVIMAWGEPQPRLLWGMALAAILALLAVTVIFHLPTNAAFAAKTVPLEAVGETLDRWLLLHWLRIALGLTAAVAAVVAVAR